MKQELMAFWKHGQYPYCLWGIVESFNGDKAYIPSYQSSFRPFLVVEKSHGETLVNKLSDLKNRRFLDMELVKNKFEEELDSLIKIPGINT